MDKYNHELLIETQRAHLDVVGSTRPFQVARKIQCDFLRTLDEKILTILAIGPGEGDELKQLLSDGNVKCAIKNICAFELSQEKVSRFKKFFPQAKIHSIDFSSPETLKILENHPPFDLIQASFVLHDQTEDGKTSFLSNAHALLREGGHLLLADPMLSTCSNIPRLLTNDKIKEEVRKEIKEYYDVYIKEVNQLSFINNKIRQDLIESLNKGCLEAHQHVDGRESFETLELYIERLNIAGFQDVHTRPGFNKVYVNFARK